MASDELVLAIRGDVAALPTSEGIMSHGVVQLGVTTNDKPLPFTRLVKISQGNLPPQLMLTLETGGPAPAWCPTLTITPTGSPVPAPPGPVGVGPQPLPAVFVPGLPPIVGVAPGTMYPPLIDLAPGTPPVPLLIATTAVASAPPGTFSSFSTPGNMHTLSITGTVVAGMPAGLYSYKFYVSACPYAGPTVPPTGRIRIGRIAVAICIQGAGFP